MKPDLKKTANSIRQDIIRMLTAAGWGNSSCIGIVDVLTALYFEVLKHNPRKPDWEERDRVFASNNIAPAVYAALAHAGYFAKKELLNYGGSLPSNLSKEVPGVEITMGPLGQELSIAAGSALAAKMDGRKHRVYCIIGDGEHNEGQVWEAIMFASKYKLNNLTVIIDRNNTQMDGYTENIMPLEPLKAKYESFNWSVLEADGHDTGHIAEALKEPKNRPTAIICHTIPGKGVSFMENKPWHKAPTKEQEKIATAELQNARQ